MTRTGIVYITKSDRLADQIHDLDPDAVIFASLGAAARIAPGVTAETVVIGHDQLTTAAAVGPTFSGDLVVLIASDAHRTGENAILAEIAGADQVLTIDEIAARLYTSD